MSKKPIPEKTWVRRDYGWADLKPGDSVFQSDRLRTFRSIACKWFRGKVINGIRTFPYKGPPRDYTSKAETRDGVKGVAIYRVK